MDERPTAKIAEALAAFQQEMPVVAKGKTAKVGSYSYTYADLADVTEAAMPVLTKHGLSFSCGPHSTDNGYELTGVLLHTSGESLHGALPIRGNNPQELGSSLTYMRRYLFGCLTGLVTDDDDDAQLAQQAAKKAAKKQPAKKQGGETGEAITQDQSRKLHAQFNDVGITERGDRLAFASKQIGRDIESSSDLTRKEASSVIEALVELAEQPFTEEEPPE
jgi:ERF superfamily